MNRKNITKLIISGVLVVISVIAYSSTFGNPISYIKAKNEISSYIDKNYDNKLEIQRLFYSFKTNGYSAIVNYENDNRYSSYIEYYNTGYINDGYQFDVKIKMEDEVRNTLESLINQGTNLDRSNMNIDPSINIEEFKYKLNDKYSGEEAINLQMQLHPSISYDEKHDPNKDVALYKNKDDFSKDVYNIVKVLEGTNYNFDNIEIYSYREDGNSNYRFKTNMKDKIKSADDINRSVSIAEGEKEKEK